MPKAKWTHRDHGYLAMFGLGGQECLLLFVLFAVIGVVLALRSIVFTGDEFVRFKSSSPIEEVFDQIEDCLRSLGDVHISKAGNIDVVPRRSLENALTTTWIEGNLRERKGEFVVDIEYSCTLSTLGWILLVIGILFFLVGLIVLLAPFLTRNKIGQSLRRALRALE